MLFMETDGLRGPDRAFAKFWNVAHTLDAYLDGWVLALWKTEPPEISKIPKPQKGEHLVAIGWPPISRRRNYVAFSLDLLRQHPEIIDDSIVVLARKDLPKNTWQALHEKLDYRPDIEGQQEGWWYTDRENVPFDLPSYHPTGALLFEKGTESLPAQALTLVDIDDYWMVLSELGARTYIAGTRFVEGDDMFFCPSGRDTVEIWRVSPVDPIPFDDIARRFDPAAVDRARDDAVSIVVNVSQEVRD
jgi:hypothetical protein